MPYQIAVQVFSFLRDLPPKFHFFTAILFGAGGVIVEKVIPGTLVGLANLVGLLVALLAGWRALRQQESTNKRKEMILEAQLKQALEPMQRRQDVTERAMKHVRQKQVQLDKSVKGIELMKDVWGMKESTGHPCILIVDDDPATLKVTAEFLKRNLNNPCVLMAQTIKQALEEIKKLPRTILLDIRIGEESGLQIIPQAKAINPDVDIVVITGWKDPNQLAAAVAMGVLVIEKPVQKDKLMGLIKRLRKDFGVPEASSDQIPVLGASGILPGIVPDESDG